MKTWTVVLEPMGLNPDPSLTTPRNKKGLGVVITNGDMRHLTAAVGFNRKNTRNKSISFEEQLEAEVAKAFAACRAINDLDELNDRIRTDEQRAEEEAAENKIKEILGKPPKEGSLV